YELLTRNVSFPPEDIVFDPNIFAIATGIEEHNNYAVDYINATRWIRQHLPHAKVSGGVSNVSFSFRGNEPVREAIHTVFLYHAIRAGMTMGIVNARQLGESFKSQGKQVTEDLAWRAEPVEARLSHALVRGITTYIIEDTEEARQKFVRPSQASESKLQG